MKEVPNIYLTSSDMIILKEYLNLRESLPNCQGRNYLFIQSRRGSAYRDTPVGPPYISNLVKRFSGFNPQTLRITCLTAMSELYGPQFLREAYGISQTHASRFGKCEDYLLEESINDILNEK